MKQSFDFIAIASWSLLGSWAIAPFALAQMVPDNTLPVNTIVTPTGLVNTITGGTERGVNLYHSFREFSLQTGSQAYFNNPSQIQNILTRITGNSASTIDGLIKANGTANLFFLNPNGMIFGPNARLQIGGSFFASTADRFKFANGSEFSAINPQAPPLLTVNLVPGLQTGNHAAGAMIINRGHLTTQQDLILDSDLLDIQGQLRAARDLTLKAHHTVQARDTSTIPLLIDAGRTLWIQGNQKVDLYALNHPNSGLFSGADLILRSANTVEGDAHYYAGRNLRIEQLNGQPGNLYSPDDPVIRARGDVTFGNYNGASLHIFAGGSVTVTGDIDISNPDPVNGLVETVLLSDGSQLLIDGRSRPTLDIRAGLSSAAIGLPGFTPNLPEGFGVTGNPSTTATITIGTTNASGDFVTGRVNVNPQRVGTINGGMVFLSNQAASGGDIQVGGIQSGEVVIDARGNISSRGLFRAGQPGVRGGFIFTGRSLSTTDLSSGNAGDVTLLAGKSIVFTRPDQVTLTDRSGRSEITNLSREIVWTSFINTASFENAGNITLRAGNAIIFDGALTLNSSSVGGRGGNITLQARAIELTNGAQLLANTRGTAPAGNITLQANSIRFEGTRTLVINESSTANNTENFSNLVATGAFSNVEKGASGNGGNIDIQTRWLRVANGAQISTVTNGRGRAGSVRITATEQAEFDGTGSNRVTIGVNMSSAIGLKETSGVFVSSGAFSSVRKDAVVADAVRNQRGSVTITTPSLRVMNGARITSSLSGIGNAGDVNLNATSILLSGAGPNATTPGALDDFSGGISVLQQGTGQGGNININTQTLQVDNGIVIAALTRGRGNAGQVNIKATESASFDRSFVMSDVQTNGVGNGGSIDITAGTLTLTNGAQLRASTSGQGNAGDITLNVVDRLFLADPGTAILANTNAGSPGRGGNITIDPRIVEINNQARIAVDSNGTGQGGNIRLVAGRLLLNQGAITAETASAQGGNITLDLSNFLVMRRNSLISATAGTAQSDGNGGNITINAPFVVAVLAEDSDIRANAFRGNGGNITINANAIFGLLPQLENTPFSDITASSKLGISGTITLNTLNLDPSRGLQQLNFEPVDPSSLVAQGCNSGRRVVEGQSRFVVLGRGGLTASPDDWFGGSPVLEDLGSPTEDAAISVSTPISEPRSTSIAEAQGWIQAADGKIYLVQSSASALLNGVQPSLIQCP